MCLDALAIDSTGNAKKDEIGLYLNYKLFNGKRSFKHVKKNLFLYWHPPAQWAVSTVI